MAMITSRHRRACTCLVVFEDVNGTVVESPLLSLIPIKSTDTVDGYVEDIVNQMS